METLAFKPASDYQRGTIFSLLYSSYESIWSPDLDNIFREFDQEVFDYPNTVGSCTFITCLGDATIGFASYDPRQGPEVCIIGHNCVTPGYRRKGYGKQQIIEIVRLMKEKGFKVIKVSTGEEEFFVPARLMYLSSGFREVSRSNGKIEYELEL